MMLTCATCGHRGEDGKDYRHDCYWVFRERGENARKVADCAGFVGGYEIDPSRPNICQICERSSTEHIRAFDGSEKAIVDRVRGGTPEQANGNALLIAAAPMMYQELQLAADTFRDFSVVLRTIGKDVMSAAADIAERHIREQLAAIQNGDSMTSPFIKAMQEALAKILSAETPSDRGVAEAEMAELIRAQYRQGRQPAFDAKAAQVGRDE